MKNSRLVFLLALLMPCMGAFSQCPTPTDLAVTNVTSSTATVSWNGNADSYTVWYGTPTSTSHFLGYGEMSLQGALGNDIEDTWTWGVMFPAEMLTGNVLTKVGFFNTVNNINDITIRVYSGGDNAPGTLLLTKVVTPFPDSYQLVTLDAPLHLPAGENLWITLEETGIWLMSMTNATDPNSKWYFNGNAWTQQSVFPDKGWIIHGHVENQDYENMEWNTLATSNESVELTGLNPETTYVVKVQSHCGQGNDSEMSEETAFITKVFECPAPTDLTLGDITYNTANLNWNGESDSYKVMYRAKSHIQGSIQGFPLTTIPSGWSQKSGLLEEILSGQSSLTNASGWEFGEGGNVFDSHAKLNYVEGVHDWLISPPVTVADNYVLNFDLAMSVYAYCAPWDLFAVLVQDVESGQWSLLRQWDNQGSAYVLQDISHTGENVSIDLNAYTGKEVRIAFYGERIEYFWNIQIHVDNVCVVVPVTASDWQTAVDNHPNASYTLTGLEPETFYEVKVGGVCGTTQSHEMSVVSFFTSPYIQEPTNVTVSDIDYYSASLGWTENGTASAWQIQLDDEPPMTVNTKPYTVTGLTPDTEYTVKVRSEQGGFFSNWSVATHFTTPFYCYPPTQLTITESTLNSATLGWTDHGTATQWQVCINGDESHLVTVNTTHYVMIDLDAQTQYTVKVRAICGETYTEWTEELSFVPVLYCNPPTLAVNNITTNTADLSWTAITGADSYTVSLTTPLVLNTYPIITGYTATDGTAGVNTNQSYPKLVDNDRNTKYCASLNSGIYVEFHSQAEFIPTAYILTTGNDNSSYHGRNPRNWVIKGKLNAGDSWTTIATVTNDNVLQDVDNTDYEFALNNTNAFRYFRFEVSAVQSGTVFQLSELRFRGQVTSFNVTSTSMPLTDLLPETEYSAKVRGNIGEMFTNWSNEVNFTTNYLPPTHLTATPKTYSSVTLSWTANSNASEWQICLNDDENNLIDASTNPFVLTGLTQQTQYTVKVRASHNGTISDWSDNVNFTTLPYCPAPTDLSALNVTCNSMMLSWNQNGTVSNWQICLNNDESNLITTNANPYSLTGLLAQTAYSVKVRGRLGGENYSDWSESISVTTTAFYQEPTNLAATEIHSNSVVLNWTENSNANEWRICLNNDMTNLIVVNTKPFTLTGLTPESTYTVKVSAYHEGSFSGWSDPISFTTLVLTPSLAVDNVNQNSANLNWTNTSGASYTVRYNRVPSAMETLIFNGFEGGGIGWSFGYFGTSMPATSAVNNAHTGSWGLKFVASSACTSQFIVSPSFEDCQSLEFYYKTENTSETFQILFYVGNTHQSSTDEMTVNTHGQWQKYTCDIPQNITGLRIQYCGQSQSALWIDDIRIFADYMAVESNTNSAQLTGLFPGTTYSAKVRTQHGGIYSEWSDAAEFTTHTPPTNLTVSNVAETEATLGWTENGNATHWQLCLNNDQNNPIDVSTNPYTLAGLNQETHYTVKVRDCYEGYYSAWSDAVDFTTLAYCTAPTGLAVDDIRRQSATLSWSADSDSYKVMYRTTGEWMLAAENLSETTFTLTGLDPETHYEVCVKGVCNGIESNASEMIGFTTLLDHTPTMSASNITYTSAGLSWTETPGADSYTVLFNNSEEIFVTDGYTATEGTQGNSGENYPNLVDNNRNSKWFVNKQDSNGHFAGCYIEFHSQHVFVPTGYVLTTAGDTGSRPGRNPKNWVIKAKLNAEDDWTTIATVNNDNVLQDVNTTDFQFALSNNAPYRFFRFEVLDVQNSSNHRFQLAEMKFLGYSKSSICITDLEQATTYTAKVRAKAGNLYSEWSDEFSFSTLFGLIAPTLTVSNVGSTTADLNWGENTEAMGYDISLNDEIVSFPSQIITGYTATSGASGYNNEGYANLVDNDRTTKWCRQMNNVYIEFHSESSFVPIGYILTTGKDNETATGRNPKDWVIKAKLNVGDAWTTIATVTNDNTMQDINTKDYEFDIDNHLPYRYFRFEVSANHGNNNFQLGEFRFLGYVPTNSLHLTDLQPETDYAVKVRSDLGGIYSEWSNTVDFRTLILPPTQLTVTDIDYYSATVGWNANSNVTQWQICLNGDEDHPILADANPYVLTGLTHHTHYTVKVRNHQDGADDTWSDEIDFTTLFNITSPTLTVSDINRTSAVLSWTEVSGVDGYTVSVNDNIIPDQIIAGFTATSGASGYNTGEDYGKLVDNNRNTKWCRQSSNIYIEFHSESSFIPTGYILTTGTDNATAHGRNPKNWVIKAKLNAGDAWTTIVSVTNDQVLQDVNTTDFEFAIDNHEAYRYFRFEVSAVQNGGTFQLGELRFRGLMTSHSRMLTDLLPETEYNVKVRAYSGETFGDWSNVVNFTTWFNDITFIANGRWNDAGNWNIGQVPDPDEEVFIAAQAVVPVGYTAQVKHAHVNDGGSITIEDGGQFIAENEVNVAVQKNILKTSYWGAGGGYTPDNWYFIASPVHTEDSEFSVAGLITEGEGNGYDLYRLNTTVWENYKAEGSHHHFGLERGRGYLYASENGRQIEFNGNAMPYSETPIPLSDGFNLVGNPYTFNTYVNRSYYKLNADRTDIALVNDNAVIAPCEGVLIDVEGTDQVTFTKTDQLAQATNNGSLAIAVARQTSNRGVAAPSDKAVVSFNEGSQLGKFYFMQQDANIYIPQDGKDFAIAFSGKRGELPLCFKAMKNGKYTITVVPENVKVDYLHLIDNLTGTDVDLLATSSYTFEGRTGDYASRFRLVFNVTENGDNEDFAFISNGDIVIIGTGTLQVIDVLGRTLLSQDLSSLNSRLSNLPFNSGVYVLRLIKGSDVKVQKIILP